MKGCRLPSCVVEHGVDAAPWVGRGWTPVGIATFAFASNPDARLLLDGREISADDLCLWPGGSPVSIVARRPSASFVVSVEEAELACVAPREGDGKACPVAGVHRVRAEELARVRALAFRLLEAVERAGPEGLGPEETQRLERRLVEGLAGLVAGRDPGHRNGTPRRAHASILERIETFLDERSFAPVYVADLCAATGLPERTLRWVLAEQVGESPMRFLRSRRLCQLRRALQAEGAAGESLARVAERHGFRHMGTLAADYWNLFGELPSETRRAAGGGVQTSSFPRVPGPATEGLRRPVNEEVAELAGAAGR